MSSKTDITFLTNIANPYNAGLYRELQRQGAGLSVVYRGTPLDEGRAWDLDTEPYEHVRSRLLENVRIAWGAGRRRGTVLVSGGYAQPVELARILALTASRSTSYFWGERLRPATFPRQCTRRLIFGQFDAIFAIGSWAVPSYRRVVTPRTLVHVLPYTATRRRAVRRNLTGPPTIGYVGSLIVRKGVDRLLSGVARLSQSDRPVIEIIGSGPEERRLREYADRHSLHVVWLGERGQAWIDHRRLSWWAQCVPSRYDGWGVVVAEALTGGVPVLGSGMVGAALDLIRPGMNGQIVYSDDMWGDAVLAYTDRRRVLEEGVAARAVGVATAAEAAAPWLLSVLGCGDERSFLADAWSDLLCK